MIEAVIGRIALVTTVFAVPLVPAPQGTAAPVVLVKSPGAIQAVTDSSFEQDVIKSNKPVVVEFWAAWCGPCRQSEANLSAIAAAHGDKVEVVRLDIDRSQATPARYGVTALPVLDVFKDGKVVKTITGAEPKAALEHDLAPFVGQ